VKLKGVRLERLRDFGDVWLALGLWRLLGLDGLLARRMSAGREDVPWPVVAAILAVARFCEPSSELHIEDTWYRRTALDDLVGVAAEQVHTDRLYAGLDQLLPHKEAIEQHLKARLGEAVVVDGQVELLGARDAPGRRADRRCELVQRRRCTTAEAQESAGFDADGVFSRDT